MSEEQVTGQGSPGAQGTIQAIVDRFDRSGGPLDCHDVSDAIRKAPAAQNESPADQAERFAFDVHPHDSPNTSPWGTYFGPFMTWPGDDGMMYESPGRSQITDFALDYWWRRAQAVQHPVLRGRYADLVWDLSRLVGTKAPIDAARLLIDSHVTTASQNLADSEIEGQGLLRRALDQALSISDKTRVATVRDTILAFEERTAQDGLPGTWGFAFDELVERGNIPLEPDQEAAIIGGLEARLARTTAQPGEPFVAEAAATRLARYYRRTQRRVDVERVVRLCAEYFGKATETVQAMVGLAWMERVHELLREFGLAEDAKTLGPVLQRLGEKTRDNLHSVAAEVNIPREKFEAYLDEMTKGSLDEVLDRIAARFLHSRGEMEAQVRRLAQEAPLQGLIEQTLLSDRGTVVCRIGSVAEDFDGRVAAYMGQSLQLNSIFLRAVVEHLGKGAGLSRAAVEVYCSRSPLFREDRRAIFASGIDAYLREDYSPAIHILTPYVEDSLRELIRIQGGSVYQPGRFGGLQEVGLGRVLEDPLVIRVFGEDTCFYLRVLLSDARGLNVRNRVAHGLIADDACSAALADRLFHVILLLAQVRTQNEDSEHGN